MFPLWSSDPFRCALLVIALAGPVPAGFASPVDFQLAGLDGTTHRLSDHRGRFVVVNFWATWCGPCLHELPELQGFRAANPEVSVLAVNFESIERAALERFVAEQRLTLPVLRAGAAPLVPFEPLKGLPTTVIVDPQGKIIAHHTGPVTRAALEAFLDQERTRRAAGR